MVEILKRFVSREAMDITTASSGLQEGLDYIRAYSQE